MCCPTELRRPGHHLLRRLPITPTPTIWSVDDNQADLDALALALDGEDVQCWSCKDAREAMDVMSGDANHDLPELLLDVDMPGLDGYEVLLLIQAEPRLEDLRS